MKKISIIVAVGLVLLLAFVVQSRRADRLAGERDRYRRNTELLMGEVEGYRVRDSLAGARVQSLELTLREYERFRAEDAALIRDLKGRNRDLSAVNKTQSETILHLQAIPRDTIIIRDSVAVPAVAVHAGDAWYDFDGLLSAGQFTGTLRNRDSLLIAETVKYKRFLGFLWRTSKVDECRLDVVSKNPHTKIIGLEYVRIEK